MTYCNNCGNQCEDNVKFCPNCGSPTAPAPTAPNHPGYSSPAPTPPAPPVYQQPTYQQPAYQQPQPAPAYNSPVRPGNVLTWGILGLAFACTFFTSFLGIIFSVIAKNKANAYTMSGAPNSGQVNTGRGLAKAGFIVGIVLTALFSLYFIILVAAFA